MKIYMTIISLILASNAFAIEEHELLKTVKTNRLNVESNGGYVVSTQCVYMLKKITGTDGKVRHFINVNAVNQGAFQLHLEVKSLPLIQGPVKTFTELTPGQASYANNFLDYDYRYGSENNYTTESVAFEVSSDLKNPYRFRGNITQVKKGWFGEVKVYPILDIECFF